jgi:integrase/recombinase XerD
MYKPTIRVYRISEEDRSLIGIQAPPNSVLLAMIEGLDGLFYSARHELHCMIEKPFTVKYLLSYFHKQAWLDLSQLRKMPTGEESVKHLLVKHRILNTDKQEALDRVMRQLEVQRYSDQTVASYRSALTLFLKYFNDIPLEKIDEEDVMDFNKVMIIDQGLSVSTQRQFTGAIKHFFTRQLHTEIDVTRLEYARKSWYLPVVLSKEEVTAMFRCTRNDKHRIILLTLYAQGLRCSELLDLKLADIDLQRDKIHVRNAKGRRERCLPMSKILKQVIGNYLMAYKPKEYLLNGKDKPRYSATSVRKVVSGAAKQAGIAKRVTPHTLRHSYATHCLELGLGLRYIQEFLGHRSPKTTMIYTHIRNDKVYVNPLDELVKGLMTDADKGQETGSVAFIPPGKGG